MEETMRYKLAVFDMDGTILNTLEDLKNCLNYALHHNGYPERSLEEVRRFVGNGIRKLVERGVPEGTGTEQIDKVFEDFKVYYKVHCTDLTVPYEGIPALIKELRSKGVLTAVVSNKVDFAVQELVERFFNGLFDMAVGDREGIAKKPAPDSVFAVLDALHVEKQDAVYIGDSDVDIATAKNAGLDSIIVEWGFRDREFLEEKGARVFAKTPEDILSILED